MKYYYVTCGVGHPVKGTLGLRHFVRSKKNKYGLSFTLKSFPHRLPAESLGTSNKLGSPDEIAAKDTNIIFMIKQCTYE